MRTNSEKGPKSLKNASWEMGYVISCATRHECFSTAAGQHPAKCAHGTDELLTCKILSGSWNRIFKSPITTNALSMLISYREFISLTNGFRAVHRIPNKNATSTLYDGINIFVGCKISITFASFKLHHAGDLQSFCSNTTHPPQLSFLNYIWLTSL